jgi:hypothetical protein
MGRPKLDSTFLKAMVKNDTTEKLKAIALKLGYQWGSEGNTGKFLDTIANLSIEEIKQLID